MIDCGTNSIRLLVADVTVRDDGSRWLRDVRREMRIVRLGQGVDATGRLAPEAIERTRVALAAYTAMLVRTGAERVRMVATSATRDAANTDEFVAMVRSTLGTDPEVISGDEEARLSFIGAVGDCDPTDGPFLVVDVGGGSTEIAVGTTHAGVSWWASFRLGSGQLAEEHLRSDPPTPTELAIMRAHAEEVFDAIDVPRPDTAVAVGGSAASLRRLVGGTVGADSMRRALGVLCEGPADAVAQRYELDPERVRLMPAGLVILAAATGCLGCELTIGNGGLREGVLLELASDIIGGGP